LLPIGPVASVEKIHKVSANHYKELQIVAMSYLQIKTKYGTFIENLTSFLLSLVLLA